MLLAILAVLDILAPYMEIGPFLAVLTSPSFPRCPYLAVFSSLYFPSFPRRPSICIDVISFLSSLSFPRRPYLAVLFVPPQLFFHSSLSSPRCPFLSFIPFLRTQANIFESRSILRRKFALGLVLSWVYCFTSLSVKLCFNSFSI